jgi:hypothetical protein
MLLLIFSHKIAIIIIILPPNVVQTHMIFTSKNRKTLNRIWAVVSLIAIVGMLGFSLVALIK